MLAHLLAVALCCACFAPQVASNSPALTCSEESAAEAANLAVRHINEHHEHGFKFKLHEILGSKYQQVAGGCHINVNMKLKQTDCHVTNPKTEDQCEVMMQSARGAVATCSSNLNMMGDAVRVISHACDTKPELSNAEMVTICPDCPTLLPLNDETGVKAVERAVDKFNLESNHANYFTLMEISLITCGYIPSTGMKTWPKFALVETVCPKNSKMAHEACAPRCPDRAHHAFCKASYSNNNAQVEELNCELYPPKDTADLAPGTEEPTCERLFHQNSEGAACMAQLSSLEPAIHQICPFPLAIALSQEPQPV